MNLQHYLMILAIIAPASVALLVAYLHRKQMRQVELFKVDNSVGLIPPPSALTRFFLSNAPDLFVVGSPCVLITYVVASPMPLTKLSALVISVSVALIFFYAAIRASFSVSKEILVLTRELARATERHLELTARIQSRTASGKSEGVERDA